jgi:hypothetical protein
MNIRIVSCLALVVSLSLIAGTPGVAAQPLAASAQPQDVWVVGQLGGTTLAVALQGTYAYTSAGARLVILDISDPAHPAPVGQSAPLPETIERIKVSGDHAYVADGEGGLYIFDISDPAHPAQLGHYATAGTALDLVVNGDYAYVADGGSGLCIVNVSNPTAPEETGIIDLPGTAYGVALAWPYAYVANEFSGIRIVNVMDPVHPMEVGDCSANGYPTKIAIDGDHATSPTATR